MYDPLKTLVGNTKTVANTSQHDDKGYPAKMVKEALCPVA
jgi:hypothetical protein